MNRRQVASQDIGEHGERLALKEHLALRKHRVTVPAQGKVGLRGHFVLRLQVDGSVVRHALLVADKYLSERE